MASGLSSKHSGISATCRIRNCGCSPQISPGVFRNTCRRQFWCLVPFLGWWVHVTLSRSLLVTSFVCGSSWVMAWITWCVFFYTYTHNLIDLRWRWILSMTYASLETIFLVAGSNTRWAPSRSLFTEFYYRKFYHCGMPGCQLQLAFLELAIPVKLEKTSSVQFAT